MLPPVFEKRVINETIYTGRLSAEQVSEILKKYIMREIGPVHIGMESVTLTLSGGTVATDFVLTLDHQLEYEKVLTRLAGLEGLDNPDPDLR